jgi:hypothetical protein
MAVREWTADETAGAAWWNGLSQSVRFFWLDQTHGEWTVDAAWRAKKRADATYGAAPAISEPPRSDTADLDRG